MQSNSYFIGRDRELAYLDLAIGSGSDGLRFALVNGQSGLGKTTLANHAVDTSIQSHGFRAVRVAGRAGGRSTPYAPLAEALPEFAALIHVLTDDDRAHPDDIAAGCVDLLSELQRERPLLIVFDDAQAMDESSIALLPYLVGMPEAANVSFVFIEQTDAIGIPDSYRSFIDGLLSRRVVSNLALQPLDETSTTKLIAHVLGNDDDLDAVPAELVTRSMGNPWFARELAEAWTKGHTDVPATIAAAATSRLYSLDELGQDLINAIALCDEGAHIGWLERMSDQRPRHFVRTMGSLLTTGLVREDGDVVSIAHPLMQQALVDDMSRAMRRAIQLELADVILQVPLPEVARARAAAHHLIAAGRLDDGLALYENAVEQSMVDGLFHDAFADAGRALAAAPSIDARIMWVGKCALLATQLGLVSAVEYFSELARLAHSRGDDELFAYALFHQYWCSNDGSAKDRLQRAAELDATGIGWSARSAATLARMEGRLEDAVTYDRRARDIGSERGDSRLEALASSKLATTLYQLGRTDEAIEMFRASIQTAIDGRCHDWAVFSWGELVLALTLDIRLNEAIAEADAALRFCADMGLERLTPMILLRRAETRVRQGNLAYAISDANEAHVIDDRFARHADYHDSYWTALVMMIHELVAVESGAQDSLAKVERAAEFSSQVGYDSWDLQIAFDRAKALYRKGDIEAAWAMARDVDPTAENMLTAEMAVWGARIGIVDDHAGILDWIRELANVARGTETVTLFELQMREVDAILALAEQGIEPLTVVANEWAAAGCALDAFRAQMVVGAHLLKTGDKASARPILEAAKKGLAECGASADADRAAALLRQTGARSRAKSRTTSVGPLTKRELEIARLVASGLKNSEVASTLFLAEKTVAAHLSNIYGKVEVRSRVQLGQWIRENDSEFETAIAG